MGNTVLMGIQLRPKKKCMSPTKFKMQEHYIRVFLQYLVKRTIMNFQLYRFLQPLATSYCLHLLSSWHHHTPVKCNLHDHHHKNLKSNIINSMHIPDISVILHYQELRNIKLHHSFHKSFTLHPILRQENLFYIFSTYILKTKLLTILPSTTRSPK